MTTETQQPPEWLFTPREAMDGGERPAMIAPALAGLVRPVEGLLPYPGNARNGDTDVIGESLRLYGQYAPVLYQRSTGHVVKGNHVMHAVLEAGREWIAATPLDVDDDTALRIVLMDNATSDRGRYDDPALIALIERAMETAGGGLDGTGIEETTYLDLLDRADRDAARILDAAKGSADGAGGLGQAVISYALVFDDTEQQNRWYAFLKWLRQSGVPGDTIAARIDEYLTGVLPEGVQ